MELGHPPRDGQPEPGAARSVGAEPVEDPLPVLGGHSPAVVGDLDPPAVVPDACGDAHDRPGGSVAARVVEDVDEQLAQPGGVAEDRQVTGHVHVEAAGSSGARELGDGVPQQRAECEVVPIQLDHPRLEPRELEEVVDQAAQPLGLVERGREVVGVGGYDAVGEVLEQCGHRRERRTQLVGDGRDQVAALAVDGGEILRHPVEGRGELADLVGGRGPDPTRVVAPSHRPRHLGHPPQRGHHPGGQQLGDAERERDADRQDEQR